MSIIPKLSLGVEYCATFQAALYIETHSLMHQSEFHGASVALSRAADKRKSLINIHKNRYTATLKFLVIDKKLTKEEVLVDNTTRCSASEFISISLQHRP